jgi:hypothetical protein
MTLRWLPLTVVLISPSLVAQDTQSGRPVLPVLDFPEPGLDDTASYQGYQTRFYRDSKQNAVQVYLEPRGGRVVTLWADAGNESAGFTVREAAGRRARLTWAAPAAEVADSASTRSIEYRLQTKASHIEVGGFLLGSMRVERDYQYAKRHLRPLTLPPFHVTEESLLVANIARLPGSERRRHLALLRADDVEGLRSRLRPTVVSRCSGNRCTARIERPSLDARNRLTLELGVDSRRVKVEVSGETVSIRTRPGAPITLAVRVTTDAAPLSPLQRNEIFSPAFLRFLTEAATATDSTGRIRYRRLERQVRGVELLSSKEKLMAGLPNFATYFGRDMMMTALMMRSIWTAGMSEHVIASVLRKLGPNGDVSHEEALGGQAIRENAVVYDSLITEYFRVGQGAGQQADTLLQQARVVLGELQKTRENYHMIDDEFQLPVLTAVYLGDTTVSAEQKRAFLLDSSEGGGTRLALLLREMDLVAKWTAPYAADPRPTNLVSFPKRDATHWRSSSWRDSDAGYAGGRFAMDVNAIWAPHALESIGQILEALPRIGISRGAMDSMAPWVARAPLRRYLDDPALVRRATETWKGARRHFEVTLGATEARQRVLAKLAWLPPGESRYWQKVIADRDQVSDSIGFLALSLDASGKPIPVVNTDLATGLFLGTTTAPETVIRDLAPFTVRYPVGLLVDSLGPLVANDAYASREIWNRFRADTYHSPRVVWGREVNLLFLGLANRINAALDGAGQARSSSLDAYVKTLEGALDGTTRAVEASGLDHNELWSYRITGDQLLPIRYGTSSDVQLWNTTDLAVQFVLARLRR